MTFGYLGGAFNFFLWYDIPIPPYGNFLVPLYFGIVGYTIIKYRFADIRLVIKRSAVFAALVVIITSIYSLIAYFISVSLQDLIGTQSVVLNGIFTAILISIGFEPLKRWLSRVTDSLFFKGEYDPQRLLATLAEKISSTLDLQKLLDTISDTLSDALRSHDFSIYLFNKEKKQYEEHAFAGSRTTESIALSQRDLARFKRALADYHLEHTALVTEELKKMFESSDDQVMGEIIILLERYQVTVAVPVWQDRELSGMFFLGPKKSGDVYTSQDIQLLEIVATQFATALDNARLYGEVRDLNRTLQQKVDEQTKDIVDKNKKMEALLKSKSEFLDIASHQLRTPVSVISGILDMFRSGSMDKLPAEKQRTFIDNAFAKSRKLNAVINDILDASDLDERTLDLKDSLERLDLSALVRSIIDYNRPEAVQKKVELRDEIADGVAIMGDKKYLEQAVANLIDNAIKYTPAGKGVTVSLTAADARVVLTVRDEGIGIPRGEQERLFQKFSRASNAKEMHTDGSGLGLFIVKKVIDAIPGAQLSLTSEENKGTTFTLQFVTA